jgi:hypothetical protein
MSDDKELEKLARRIKVRAIQRCGELLGEFNKGVGRPDNRGGGSPISEGREGRSRSQAEAGRNAGLSPRQIKGNRRLRGTLRLS